jgi:molybdopterin-guanine dinucleotide biosynthesis protein A
VASPGQVAGVILAGGKASRMGGAERRFCRSPASRSSLTSSNAFSRGSPTSSSIATSDLSRFASFGIPVIADSLAESAGPLAALLAGLEWHAESRPDTSYVVTAPTDTPFFPSDLVDRFLAASKHRQRRSWHGSGVHPVIGLWPVEMAPDLRRALEQGMRKVGAWAELQSAIESAFPQGEVGGKSA